MLSSVNDEREHRRGLVLGLTLAEVLLLLLFLLLLALAARLHELEQETRAAMQGTHEVVLERDRLAAELAKAKPLVTGSIDREGARELEVAYSVLRPIIAALKSDASKYEATAAAVKSAARINPEDPPAPLQRALAILEILGPATRPEDVTALASMRAELETRINAARAGTNGKHNWPPIITLSEANGYFFETGSAELSPQFRTTLAGSVITRLLDTMKEYDVDIIEVIGHTDEQRIVDRPSNLDKTLIPFLQQKALTERFIPADNAGLGLARAAAVVRVLGNDQRLAGLRILPFSGGQLVDVGDRRADGASSGDVRERRRIEIRVRRSDKQPPVEKASWSAETQMAMSGQPIIGPASVVDGDTIDVAGARIRIWGVDAIESKQMCTRGGRPWDCATDITFGLTAHLDGQTVTCQPKGRDRHDRIVAACTARNGDLGEWLVYDGLALDYAEYSGGAYKVQEAAAKAAKRGVWRGEFMPPWEWRRQNNLH